MLVRFMCYDEAADAAAAATKLAADAAAAKAAADAAANKSFSQDDVNKFVAEERRKTETKFKPMLEAQERQLKTALDDRGLSEKARNELENRLSDVQLILNTKELTAKEEVKKLRDNYESQLKDLTDKVAKSDNKYKDELVKNALVTAIGGDAFSTEKVYQLLKPFARISDDGGEAKVVLDFPDVDENGASKTTLRSPEQAIKRTKELEEWAFLWKSNQISGVGGQNHRGGANGQPVDFNSMTPAQFMEMRKTPEGRAKLGLPSQPAKR